jgi:hypothetical protein
VKKAEIILLQWEATEVAFKTVRRKITAAEKPKSQSLNNVVILNKRAKPLLSKIKANQTAREKMDNPRHLRIS